ncbi:MAG TPA: DUF1992 domain-containing protein [Candidatus Saccharimonadales bacterium]|nr:DUF1992 domain-containing protein [Candidatus Saccharimonadales bacterium]
MGGVPRRDRYGREVGETLESLIERQIREATEDGRFDDLPHQGARLPLEDDSAAGEWALAHRMLRNAGAAPPWIESDKEVRALQARRDELLGRAGRVSSVAWRRARADFADLLDQLDSAIARVNAEAPTDRQHRRPVDRAGELSRFDAFGPDRR